MKFTILIVISIMSLTVFAEKYDGDLSDIYISWCEKQNVMTYNQDYSVVILQNCAAEQKVCVSTQKTTGKSVFYRAFCQEVPGKY